MLEVIIWADAYFLSGLLLLSVVEEIQETMVPLGSFSDPFWEEVSVACSDYVLAQYVERHEFVYTADEVLNCIFQRWDTDDEVIHNLRGTNEAWYLNQEKPG